MLLPMLYVSIGGFFGSIARFFLANISNSSPIGTWIANIIGAVLLGFLLQMELTNALFYILTIGFCGAYTTFSTFGKETMEFILNDQYGLAFIYVLSSFVVSLGIVYFIYIA